MFSKVISAVISYSFDRADFILRVINFYVAEMSDWLDEQKKKNHYFADCK